MDEQEEREERNSNGKPRLSQSELERFMTIQAQGFDPITLERSPSDAEIAKQKGQQSKHEFRKFWVLWAPAGFVLAFFITLATNMGTAGFFFAWLGCTVVIWGIGDTVLGNKGPSE
jgi:hypothetical protein